MKLKGNSLTISELFFHNAGKKKSHHRAQLCQQKGLGGGRGLTKCIMSPKHPGVFPPRWTWDIQKSEFIKVLVILHSGWVEPSFWKTSMEVIFARVERAQRYVSVEL
jgi:hypothetical protein